MNKTKKILSIILAVMMILTAVPLTGMTAFAAGTDFVIDGNGVLTAYNGAGGDIVIPDGVTSIGDEAFLGCTKLTSIEIPDSVTSIGNKAFEACENLASIEIPDGVTSIGDEAFSYCFSLTSIVIPDGVTSISMGAFYSCIGLKSVTLSGSVTSIGDYAFCWCDSLTDVYFIGTEEQRNKMNEMSIGSYNQPFTQAIIRFIVKHEHMFDMAWTTNATAHWHKCTSEDCDIEDYTASTVDGIAYGAHTWENGKCSVCEYECTHNFVNGVCETCGYEESAQPKGYSIFVYYDGLNDETASYGSVSHDIITEPYYVIPENPNTVKEGFNFNGFYCTNTSKMVQIGESIPLSDFIEKEDGYYLYLSARFSEKEKPGVTYTDIDRYYVTVSAQYPDDPYAYLEDSDAGMLTFDDEFEKLDGQNVGTVAQPRQLMLYARMGFNFMGYRSLLTGNVFETGNTLDVNKLPEAVFVGYELQEINENEGYRISLYEVNDYVEPIFEYLGAVGGFLEPMYECTVNYYIPVEPDENEETTGNPLQFYSYAGSDVHTLAMLDLDTPMELTCQPDYMEDLGYVLDGYGALDDDEITYPDGLIFMDQYSTNDNAGHLTYDVKLFYTEADEDATEEELLAAAKEKIAAKYQDILDDDFASEGVKTVAAAILADVENAADRNEMKEICRKGEESIRLQEAKDMAIAEIMTLAPEGAVTDAMQAVLNQAAAAIQASDTDDNFEDIITEARSEINRLIRDPESEIISVTEITEPTVGSYVTLEFLISKPVAKLQFVTKNGNTFTYSATSGRTISIVNNDDGTQTWQVEIMVYRQSDTYSLHVKDAKTGWSDNYYEYTLADTNDYDATVISCELPPEITEGAAVKAGMHNIVIKTSKDIAKVQFAYNGETATYSRTSARAKVVEEDDCLVWTISQNFYVIGEGITYTLRTRTATTSFEDSGISFTVNVTR